MSEAKGKLFISISINDSSRSNLQIIFFYNWPKGIKIKKINLFKYQELELFDDDGNGENEKHSLYILNVNSYKSKISFF